MDGVVKRAKAHVRSWEAHASPYPAEAWPERQREAPLETPLASAMSNLDFTQKEREDFLVLEKSAVTIF